MKFKMAISLIKHILFTSCTLFLAATLCSCGVNRYSYINLSPAKEVIRKATGEYESITKDDVEIRLSRVDFEKFEKSEKWKNKSDFMQLLKRLKKLKNTVFYLSIINDKGKELKLNPESVTIRTLGEYKESSYIPLATEDINSVIADLSGRKKKTVFSAGLASYFLTASQTLTDVTEKEYFLIFPYQSDEEQMVKVGFADFKIDNEPYDLEYSFFSADKLERTKRIATYSGMATGLIAIIVAVVGGV